jgi:hypothetical protein
MNLRLLLILPFLFIVSLSSGQQETDISARNELTIYVIPSKVKYDWSSPRTLYKSYLSNYKRNIFRKKRYLTGHAFVELRTPLSASGRIFTGMCSASRKEQKELVFKEYYGLSILGADTEGKLESSADLDNSLEEFSRKGQLAFMTFFISDEATLRMLQFFESFKDDNDSNNHHGARYGGAFWPRYKGEGAGCSAFAISFLDLAGLLKDEFSKWIVKVNIPMELIGGPYNHNKKVRFNDIKKYKSWTIGQDTSTSSYEPFEIYDPTLIYEWIQNEWNQQDQGNDLSVKPLQLNKARGILIDSRNQALPADDIFQERKNHSIFIDYYLQKYTAGN